MLYDILNRWYSATEEEIKYVKRILMPDDDIEQIKFKVTVHPDVCNGSLYISWYDIDVFQSGHNIGYITIDARNGDTRYIFRSGSIL